jgi:hypothetical protein
MSPGVATVFGALENYRELVVNDETHVIKPGR